MSKVYQYVKVSRLHPNQRGYLTEDRVYQIAGVDECGIVCIIDDCGNPFPLDDGYGIRFVDYKPVETTDG